MMFLSDIESSPSLNIRRSMQANQDRLNPEPHRYSSKLWLENKVLTKEDFLLYFGQNGRYSKVQYLIFRVLLFTQNG